LFCGILFSSEVHAQFRLVGGGQVVTQVNFNNPSGPLTSQFFVLESTTGSAITFNTTASTSAGGNWLTVKVYPSETTTGTTGNSVEFKVNPNISPGHYGASVLFQQQGNPTVQLSIPVSLIVGTGTGGGTTIPGFTANPSSINLTYVPGSASPTQSVTLSSNNGTVFSYNAQLTSGTNFVSITSGNTGSAAFNNIVLTFFPSGLLAQTVPYTGNLQFTIAGQAGAINIPIALTVIGSGGGTSAYAITPTTIHLNSSQTSQLVIITPSNASLPYFYSTSAITLTSPQWLSASPSSSPGQVAGQQSFSVLANATGLTQGVVYTGIIRVFVNAQFQDIVVTFIPGTTGGGGGSTPVIGTISLLGGVVASPYSQTLNATGGQQPYTWTQSGLPEGLSLDPATGVITGFPARADTFVTSISVRDGANRSSTSSFTIVIQRASGQTPKLSFVPLKPCRLMETRAAYNFEGRTGSFGPPFLAANETRTLALPASNVCQIPAASAFVLNVTVIPRGPLDFVTVFPGDESLPEFRTVSSFDGQIIANATIVRAASGGVIKIFTSGDTDVVVDISGYFTPASAAANLAYYPVTPCRAVETRMEYRVPAGPFGPPTINTNETRRFRLSESPACSLPSGVSAYSATITVVPQGPLAYLTAWPAGTPQPNVSTMNSFQGRVLANNVIIPAGTDGAIDVFAYDRTDLLVDITGYFAPDDGVAGVYYVPIVQCRIANTSSSSYAATFGGPMFGDETTRTMQMASSPRCQSIPSTAKGYMLNLTAMPANSPLPFITVYPTGQHRPDASILNAFEGQTVSNAAIIPAGTNGAIDVFTFRKTHALLEVSGYFSR